MHGQKTLLFTELFHKWVRERGMKRVNRLTLVCLGLVSSFTLPNAEAKLTVD